MNPWFSQSKRWRAIAAYSFAFIWPFLVYWRFVWPVDGGYRGIGNDFDYLYYNPKAYLLSFLAKGMLPLWSPAEGAGFPFYSNPFAAVFYPLNFILAPIYYYLKGYSTLDHQIFTVAGIAIFSTGAVFWLRMLGLSFSVVVASAALVAMNFKFSDIARFPNAVHAAAWYPWVLAFITMLISSHTLTKRLKAIFGLIVTLICLATSGYPYFAYYSLFLFPPYTLLAIYIEIQKGASAKWIRRNCLYLILTVGAAALLISPYLAHMRFMLAQTTDRAGASFDYSVMHDFTWDDTIGSLLFPPVAQTEGWAYGGIIPMILAVYYLIWGWVGRHNSLPWWRSWLVRVCIVAWILMIWSITHVRDSEFFEFLWYNFPGFASMRVWGRIQIVLVPVICLLTALGLSDIIRRITTNRTLSIKNVAWFCLPLAFAILIVLSTQIVISHRPYDGYWTGLFPHFLGTEGDFISRGRLSALIFYLCIIFFFTTGFLHSRRKYLEAGSVLFLPMLCILLTAWEVSPWIARIWTYPLPRAVAPRDPLDPEKNFRIACKTPRQLIGGVLLGSSFGVGPVPSWYYKRFNTFYYEWQDKERESRDILLGLRDGKRFYFSPTLDNITPKSVLASTKAWTGSVSVRRYQGELIELSLHLPAPGYLIVIDNWDPAWFATLNTRRVPIELALGTFKAVKLHAGRHNLKLRYAPFKMLGLWPRTTQISVAGTVPNVAAAIK